MANISPFRRETVVGTFRTDAYETDVIKRALLRLYSELHSQERRAPLGRPAAGRGRGPVPSAFARAREVREAAAAAEDDFFEEPLDEDDAFDEPEGDVEAA
eukprot:3112828-Lingulodinium_polyedra.AAC.1